MKLCVVAACENRANHGQWCAKHYTRWKRHGDPLIAKTHFGPLAERILAKLIITESCWLWAGSHNYRRGGYAMVGEWRDGRGKSLYVHRWMYENFVGPIPEGLQIDHLCRNPGCINPEHLEVVTQRQNILRGVGVSAQAARKTHCPAGHEYTADNMTRRSLTRGSRECRICKNEQRRITREQSMRS